MVARWLDFDVVSFVQGEVLAGSGRGKVRGPLNTLGLIHWDQEYAQQIAVINSNLQVINPLVSKITCHFDQMWG